MRKLIFWLILSVVAPVSAFSQVAINTDGTTPDNSAMLDVKSTTKGLLIPRMTMADRGLISNPATGLIIYQTDNNPGLYFYGGPTSPTWKLVGSNAGQWQTNGSNIYFNTGNVGIGTSAPTAKLEVTGGDAIINGLTVGRGGGSPGTNTAMGSYALSANLIDNLCSAFGSDALRNSNGAHNTAVGALSLRWTETGHANTAIGTWSLMMNTTGQKNTATGAASLYQNTTGRYNMAFGYSALYNNTTGYSNVAIGVNALYSNSIRSNLVAVGDSTLYNNGLNVTQWYHAINNTAIGSKALFSNTTGGYNTATGYQAGFSNNQGEFNTSNGCWALYSNTAGSSNSAFGMQSLYSNTTGENNTAIGSFTMYDNTTGMRNTAIGSGALYENKGNSRSTAIGRNAMLNADDRTEGRETYNTAVGYHALYGGGIPSGNTGQYNTAVGDEAMYSNTSGNFNTAAGYQSLYANNTGSYNTAMGRVALASNLNGGRNVAFGYYSLNENTTGEGNVGVGPYAGQLQSNITNGTFVGRSAYAENNNLSNVMALGYAARVLSSNAIVIGNSSIGSIGGYEPWTNLSDGRYKTAVQENVAGLDFILRLRPVTYHLDAHKLAADLGEDREIDENGNIRQKTPSSIEIQSREKKAATVYTGFIAQEVLEAANEAGYDFSGVHIPENETDKFGLAYSQFVVPLVKAVQELSARVEELEREVEELRNKKFMDD